MIGVIEAGDSEHTHHGRVIVTKTGEYSVIDCEPCGFAHVLPLPDQKTLDAYYREQFYQQSHPDYFKEYDEDAEWWREQADEILDRINLKPHDWALDYGCGPGWMIGAARKRSISMFGWDESETARDYCRRYFSLRVFNQDPLQNDTSTMKAIVLYQVLEHLRDPAVILRQCREKLTDGGWLVVCVPNDFNPLQKILWKTGEPYWVAPPEHLNYFNPQSIVNLIHSCGFDAVETYHTYPMELFILQGRDYRGNPKLGRQCHHERVAMEKRLGGELKRKIYWGFAAAGIGREIIVFARKA